MSEWNDAPHPSQPVRRLLFTCLMDLSTVAESEAETPPRRSARGPLRVVRPPATAGPHVRPGAGELASAAHRIGDVSVFDQLPPCAWQQSTAWRARFAATFRRLAFDVVYHGIPITRSPADELAVHIAMRVAQPRVHPVLRREWRELWSTLLGESSILLHYRHGKNHQNEEDELLPPEQWFREYRPRYPVIHPVRSIPATGDERGPRRERRPTLKHS